MTKCRAGLLLIPAIPVFAIILLSGSVNSSSTSSNSLKSSSKQFKKDFLIKSNGHTQSKLPIIFDYVFILPKHATHEKWCHNEVIPRLQYLPSPRTLTNINVARKTRMMSLLAMLTFLKYFSELKEKQFVQKKKNRPIEKRFTQWIVLLIGLVVNSSVYVYILYLHSMILPVQQQCG